MRADFEELAQIGAEPSGGVSRAAFSKADFVARRWFRDKALSAGLQFRIDAAGNQVASLPGRHPSVVVTGSHLDTVPNGGRFDGSLGVLAGLESLRCIKEMGLECRHGLEVISFSDEEGAFGGMLGSMAMSGKLSSTQLQTSVDVGGDSLLQAAERGGLDLSCVEKATAKPGSIKAFIELHIEQGPVLENLGKDIGIVDAICGLFTWKVTVVGQENHSGTTPMNLRRDAFSAVAEFWSRARSVLKTVGSDESVCNLGKVELFPGALNVVPGKAEFFFEARDPDPGNLRALSHGFRAELLRLAESFDLNIEVEVLSWLEPASCSPEVGDSIEAICRSAGFSSLRMTSGAGHDTQQIASIAPVSMIFVPSKDGVSHSPDEYTEWVAVERGASVLLNTLLYFASSNDEGE